MPRYKLNTSNCDLTQTTELANDSGQRVVGDTFQLAADPIRHRALAQVPRLNVSLEQRHDLLSHLVHSTCWGTEDGSLYVNTISMKLYVKWVKQGV